MNEVSESVETNEERGQFFRAKWMLDGSKTLAEAAQKAREFANWLQGLHDQGYVLEDEITDDYATYYKPE